MDFVADLKWHQQEDSTNTSNSQNETTRVLLLENVDVSTGEVPDVFEKSLQKANNLMGQHELKMRQPGRLKNRPTYIDDY